MRNGPSIGLTRAGTGAFSPAAIFAGANPGVWYDPSDMATLFQDVAGTIPVTASGQTVALMLDKSGGGNHASQATAANRPLFQDSGGVRWLEFDGVNDRLTSSTFAALTQPNTAWCAFRPATAGSTTRFIFDGIAAGFNHHLRIEVTTGLTRQGAGALFGTHTLVAGADIVTSHLFNTTASQWRADNGAPMTGNNGTNTLTGVQIGAGTGGSTMDCRFYGFLIANGDRWTAFGSQMRTWLAAKQGRTL
jgi:hypothetical protein